MAEWSYIFLFLISIIAGIVDAIAGGGGLITVPSLLLVGLPPMTVLGTNRLQAVVGELTTSMMFLRSKQFPGKGLALGLICTSVGAILGTFAVGIIAKEILEQLLPVLMVCITLYSIFAKKLKATGATAAILSNSHFMVICGLLIGFYNGFFGPGTGTFWMLAFVTLLGYTIKQATMATKPLNLLGNVIALILFIWLGCVNYQLGLIMGLGQIIGSIIGSKCVISFGNRFVRPVFISVTLVMTSKLIYENFTLAWFV
ncbi:TPA: TSUP family transporter [Vibrio vulnificus]|nr:TSUP family transporter [Vibrio vulnificus]HDY7992964.1 TSUP family transporter [Vibrio vulnificus]HDY8044000.1 TSUP family transporter [Vibrio vulnificus]